MEYEKAPVLGSIIAWMDDNDMDYGPFAATMALSLLVLGLFLLGISGGQVLAVVIALAPIWLPVALFLIFYTKWMEMIGLKYYLNRGRATLRIKMPEEILKSPEAMEVVLSQIHNTANPDNLMQTYLDGKRPLTFAFEIVSIGGEVRFYVNVPRKQTKDAFEANMYSQYPGIEIVEEPVDYAAEIPLDTDEYEWFSAHMGKKKDGQLPLKTYIDYGLQAMPKEEEKIDPITPTIEVLSSIKPHERLYIQYICTSYREESFKNGQLFPDGKDWKDTVSETISAILQRDPKTKKPIGDDTEERQARPQISEGEGKFVSAIERIMNKYMYKTGIRWVYITKKGAPFNSDLFNPVIRSFSQFDSGGNAIGVRWRTDFDYKDLFPGGKKKALAALKRQELKEYKLRKYFPKGSSDVPKMFSVEELATIFHLPGRVAITPGLGRIPSRRSEAPPNLPVGEV